jgi:hypothetical protein
VPISYQFKWKWEIKTSLRQFELKVDTQRKEVDKEKAPSA